MSTFKFGDMVQNTVSKNVYMVRDVRYDGRFTVAGFDGLYNDPYYYRLYDFEAKYNALVSDLIAATEGGSTRVWAYVREHLMPKPKQYDVTLRLSAMNESDVREAASRVGQKIVNVTEVTDA